MTDTTFTGGDVEAFKQAFRRHAAGVAVVTARDVDGRPVGFTATSLASLAAVPPLATFSTARSASTWHALENTDWVVIHMLGAANRELAQKLSGHADDRFVGEHWHEGPHGVPILNGVTAWMLGRIVERVQVAASAIVVAQIEEGGLGPESAPLLYHERAYHAPRPL